MFALLISKGLKPEDIGKLTLCEALLYTLGAERPGITREMAEAKGRMLSKLGLEDRIQLAIIRSGG